MKTGRIAAAQLQPVQRGQRHLNRGVGVQRCPARASTRQLGYLDGEAQRQFASLEIPMGMGLAGWVAENNKAILNGNPSVEPGYLNDPSKFSTLGSALAVPLDSMAGVTHVLSLYRQGRDAFRTQELNVLLSISAKVARRLELSPQLR